MRLRSGLALLLLRKVAGRRCLSAASEEAATAAAAAAAAVARGGSRVSGGGGRGIVGGREGKHAVQRGTRWQEISQDPCCARTFSSWRGFHSAVASRSSSGGDSKADTSSKDIGSSTKRTTCGDGLGGGMEEAASALLRQLAHEGSAATGDALERLARMAEASPRPVLAALLQQEQGMSGAHTVRNNQTLNRRLLPAIASLGSEDLQQYLLATPLHTIGHAVRALASEEQMLHQTLDSGSAKRILNTLLPLLHRHHLGTPVSEAWQGPPLQPQTAGAASASARASTAVRSQDATAAAASTKQAFAHLLPSCLTLATHCSDWELVRGTTMLMAMSTSMASQSTTRNALALPPGPLLTSPTLAQILTHLHMCDADLSPYRARIVHLAALTFNDVNAATAHLYPALACVFPGCYELRLAMRTLSAPDPAHSWGLFAEKEAQERSTSDAAEQSTSHAERASGHDAGGVSNRLASLLHPISALTKSITDSATSAREGRSHAPLSLSQVDGQQQGQQGHSTAAGAPAAFATAACTSPRQLEELSTPLHTRAVWSLLSHFSVWRGDMVSLHLALLFLKEHNLSLLPATQLPVTNAVISSSSFANMEELVSCLKDDVDVQTAAAAITACAASHNGDFVLQMAQRLVSRFTDPATRSMLWLHVFMALPETDTALQTQLLQHMATQELSLPPPARARYVGSLLDSLYKTTLPAPSSANTAADGTGSNDMRADTTSMGTTANMTTTASRHSGTGGMGNRDRRREGTDNGRSACVDGRGSRGSGATATDAPALSVPAIVLAAQFSDVFAPAPHTTTTSSSSSSSSSHSSSSRSSSNRQSAEAGEKPSHPSSPATPQLASLQSTLASSAHHLGLQRPEDSPLLVSSSNGRDSGGVVFLAPQLAVRSEADLSTGPALPMLAAAAASPFVDLRDDALLHVLSRLYEAVFAAVAKGRANAHALSHQQLSALMSEHAQAAVLRQGAAALKTTVQPLTQRMRFDQDATATVVASVLARLARIEDQAVLEQVLQVAKVGGWVHLNDMAAKALQLLAGNAPNNRPTGAQIGCLHRALLHTRVRIDTPLHARFLAAIGDAGDTARLIDSYVSLKSAGVYITRQAFKRVASAFSKTGNFGATKKIVDIMMESGQKPLVAFYNSIFAAVTSQEELDEVQRLLQDMSDKGVEADANTFVILARKHLRFNQPNKAISFLSALNIKHLPLTSSAVSTWIRALTQCDQPQFKQIEAFFDELERATFDPDGRVYSATAAALMRSLRREALSVAVETPFPVWEDIAERAGPCKPLLQRLYKHVMREKQHKADANFYLNMLACCAYTADVNLAEELTRDLACLGHGLNDDAYTSLISTYASAGMLDAMRHAYDEMRAAGISPPMSVYHATIAAYGRARYIDGAMEVYDDMIAQGVYPDHTMNRILIEVCLIDRGSVLANAERFQRMQR